MRDGAWLFCHRTDFFLTESVEFQLKQPPQRYLVEGFQRDLMSAASKVHVSAAYGNMDRTSDRDIYGPDSECQAPVTPYPR